MSFSDYFKDSILKLDRLDFPSACLELFDYQFNQCKVYRQYCGYMGKSPSNVSTFQEVPFLPIEFFKTHAIKSGRWKEEKIFKSSGTTHSGRSHHHIRDLSFYLFIACEAFKREYGKLSNLRIAALLPSYHENGDSSLIAMIDDFLKKATPASGYYFEDHETLARALSQFNPRKLLIGVSYALLDLAEAFPIALENIIVMETGGMKGRRREITRDELHDKLKKAFQQKKIHSEYGMVELTSQAYGADGNFRFPAWANVLIREINDPLTRVRNGKVGGINIIDLANVDTCAFIETKDLGKQKNNAFEVLGRFDHSDTRGCNLLV